jgi:sulfur relay (sulfurtransferase) complex TusBCD TusD component (DsrE family)
MKIAMVTAFWGPAYPTGSGVYANELAKILTRKGHVVHLFFSNEGSCDYEIEMEGAVIH